MNNTELIARLRKRNENGSLAEITESDQLAAADALEAAQPEFPVNWAMMLHYPECWDTAAYPELRDAIHEALAWSGCSVCKPAQPAGEPVAWHPTEAAIAALKRFEETCAGNEGYDVPKDTMRNLQAIGLVYRTHGNVYCITDYGHHILAATVAHPAPQVPMTNHKARELWQTIDTGDTDDDVIAFARAIEAHHNIGVKP